MTIDEKKSFFRFVNSAASAELERKLTGVLYLTSKFTDTDAIADAEWMIRQISQELDARKEAGL